MAKKYLDYDGLAYFWEKIKNRIIGKIDDVNYDNTNKKLTKTKEGVTTDIVSVATLKTDMALKKADVGLANVVDGAQVNVLQGIQKNGTTVSITNKIANITVPTKTSDITNDSGFITSADVPEGAVASATTPKMNGTAAVGIQTAFARGDHVHPVDTSRAPLASPTFTGTPKAPTAAAATDNTQIATTAFVHDVVDALDTGVNDVRIGTTSIVQNGLATIPLTNSSTFGAVKVTQGNGLVIPSNGTIKMNLASSQTAGAMSVQDKNIINSIGNIGPEGYVLTSAVSGNTSIIKWAELPSATASKPGVVKLFSNSGNATDGTMTQNSITTALNGKAPLTSPALTGTPTAPTATAGTNSTQIATTAFVTSAIQTAQTGAASFQGTAPTTFAPTNYKKGYYWVVGTAGTYAGETCEPGDMIFAVADYVSSYKAADFNVIQTNLDITSITNAEIDTICAA